jgi:hypothetical protein
MKEFNSQICTTREQSERLLSLGLKKETADMVLVPSSRHDGSDVIRIRKSYIMEEDAILAWSLHRLLNLSPESVKQEIPYFTKDGNVELVNRDGIVTKAWGGESLYDALIKFFQWLIKEGYFDKAYLV